jgi:hypothetical protein
MENAKLKGSNLVDYVPQNDVMGVTACPLGCPECYYNFAVRNKTSWAQAVGAPPLIQDIDKIIRVNSGLDSNLWREMVIERTAGFPHKFYNTSLPLFDLPGPIVLTANPGYRKYQYWTPNSFWDWGKLMFVRFLVPDLSAETRIMIRREVELYWEHGVFVTLTFMRYREKPERSWGFAEEKHFDHTWWAISLNEQRRLYEGVKEENGLMGVCGGLVESQKCVDCGICEYQYWTSRYRGPWA